MDLFQVDDEGRLFIAPDITDWTVVAARDIDVVIDLEGGLDPCIPCTSNQCLYVYFPFDDDDQVLPNMAKTIASRTISANADSHCQRTCI